MISRLQETSQKVRIRLLVLGRGQTYGESDVVLNRNYTTTLRCIENNSEAYVMPREEFLRLFKTNEEAWKVMFIDMKLREKQIFDRCFNFVGVSNEDQKLRLAQADRSINVDFEADRVSELR